MIPHSAFHIPHSSRWGVYLVTDRHQTRGRDLLEVVEAALAGGVRAIQLREKDLSTDQLYQLAMRLLPLTRAAGAALLINDRVDVAMAAGADGVQLSRRSLPPPEVRRLLGPAATIGISCHSVPEVQAALGPEVDFAVLGPIYPTPAKARYGPPLTPAVLRRARDATRLPLIAIGGIKAEMVPEVLGAGADGVAVISAIMTAEDPAAAARELLRAAEAARVE